MILIATPYYNPITPETKASVGQVLSAFPHSRWEKRFGVFIDANRHSCVTDKIDIYQKLPKEITHVLFWDSDIYHPNVVEYLKRMIVYDKMVITGSYPGRYADSAAGMWKKGNPGTFDQLVAFKNKGLKKAEWTGAGFLLCKREALELLPFPWFRYPIINPTATTADNAGEDIGFCLNCYRNNIPIWIDCDSKLHHKPNVKKEGADMADEKIEPRNNAAPTTTPEQAYAIAVDCMNRMGGEAMKVQKILGSLANALLETGKENDMLRKENAELKARVGKKRG